MGYFEFGFIEAVFLLRTRLLCCKVCMEGVRRCAGNEEWDEIRLLGEIRGEVLLIFWCCIVASPCDAEAGKFWSVNEPPKVNMWCPG